MPARYAARALADPRIAESLLSFFVLSEDIPNSIFRFCLGVLG